MSRYRKRAFVIEAERWSGSNWHQILDFAGRDHVFTTGADLWCRTLEGDMKASPGDWIIRGEMGEIYACKPDVFEATYEPVEEGEGEA